MKVVVKVYIKDTMNSFRSSGTFVTHGMRKAVANATEVGKRSAYMLAPVDTGYYRSTFRTELWSDAHQFYGAFGTDDEKGFALETGRHDQWGNWIEGKPHFEVAARAAELTLNRAMEKLVNDV